MGVKGGIAACIAGALLAIAGTALAAGAQTQRVSVTASGGEPNQPSYSPAVSADGRFVAYFSSATDIVPGVGGGHNQSEVFLYDRQTGTTRLVSESSAGVPGDKYSYEPAISANGRYVAFGSQAHNLVPRDRNRSEAVYWHDMKTGKTRRVDVNSKGKWSNSDSASPSISNDGDVVTFSSSATNLTPAKPKASRNEYVHDMKTGRTLQVNVSPTGKPGNGECHKPSVSANGRLIAFASRGTNLVKGRSTGWQIFVRDLKTKETVVASLSSSGKPGDGLSSHPVISGDGRSVAFESKATNLVAGDTNNAFDVFLRDLTKGKTTRVSVTSDGGQANRLSLDPAISNHGGYVAYWSDATSMTPGQVGNSHVFLYSGRGGPPTREIDVNDAGTSGDNASELPAISADGRFVAFDSVAANLVPGPASQDDVYIRGPLH